MAFLAKKVNQLFAWLAQIFSSWKFWLVVEPWDVGVRVRLGKIANKLKPGLHFRIPFLDQIALVNTRVRVATTPPITIGNGIAGRARVVSAVVGYRVFDPLKALMTYTVPTAVVFSVVQAELVKSTDAEVALEAARRYFVTGGIEIDFLALTEDVKDVRTYRILNSHGGVWGDVAQAAPQPAGLGVF